MQPTQLPLKDIHLPAEIGWWPLAPGWWLLALLVILLVAGLSWTYKRLTRRTAIKTANKLLSALKQDHSLDTLQKISQLSVIMRRVAISQYPRRETASLTGAAWLAFLDQSVDGAPFTEGVGRALADVHFKKTPPTDLDVASLIRVCETWLKANTQSRAVAANNSHSGPAAEPQSVTGGHTNK